MLSSCGCAETGSRYPYTHVVLCVANTSISRARAGLEIKLINFYEPRFHMEVLWMLEIGSFSMWNSTSLWQSLCPSETSLSSCESFCRKNLDDSESMK